MAKRTDQQKLKNSAWRSKLDDATLKRLSPKLYAQRQTNARIKQENNTLYNPAAMLSGGDLRSAVNSMVNNEVDPAVAAVDRTIANRQAQGTQMQAASDASYDRQSAALAQHLANQQGFSQAAVNNTNANTGAAISAIQNAKPAGMDNLKNADPAFTGQIQGQLQTAAAEAATRGQAAANFTAAQTGSQNNLIAAMAANSTVQKGEANRSITDKTTADVGEYTGKKLDLEASKGSLRSKYLTDFRQQMFTNAATSATLGLNKDKLAAQLKQDGITNQLNQDKLDETKTQNDIANTLNQDKLSETQRNHRVQEGIDKSRVAAMNNKNNGGNGKDPFGNTPKQQMAAQDSFTKAMTVAQQYHQKGDNFDTLYQLLVSPQGGNLNPTYARAAAQIATIGRVGSTTAAELRKRGVTAGYRTKANTKNASTSHPHG